MKSIKVLNPRRNKCSAVVEKNCLVAEYRVLYRIRAAYHNYYNYFFLSEHEVTILILLEVNKSKLYKRKQKDIDIKQRGKNIDLKQDRGKKHFK